MTKKQEFQTVRSEGGLLPPDLLRRISATKNALPGTRLTDYNLLDSDRLNDVITQSWTRLKRYYADFQKAARSLPAGEAATALTNEKWNLPLLRELGFGPLPASPSPVIGERTFPINRFLGTTAIHCIGCGLNLDRRATGTRGSATNPHGLVQEFLNRSPDHLWAILTNGLRFRILRDNQALSRQSFLEFDLEAMFTGEVFSDFVLLWLTAHATRFTPQTENRAESCWLEQWTKTAAQDGTRALEKLQAGVEKALQILGEAFVSHPRNTALRESLRSGELHLNTLHEQLLRVVYRLLFLFVAEDRTLDGNSLLHPIDTSDTAAIARERYARHYSTSRLRTLASTIKGSRHGDLWEQFGVIVGAVSGHPHFEQTRKALALPALGSLLWNPHSTRHFNPSTLALTGSLPNSLPPSLPPCSLSNADFLDAIRNLAFTTEGKLLRPVDYKNLGAEELGGVYTSLLALTPQINADGTRFTFAEFAGNARKTSGSYYTPDCLVQCLLDSALDPVVEERLKWAEELASKERATRGIEIYVSQFLSGSDRLAEGDGSGRAVLPDDSDVPQGRTVRNDVADLSRRDLDSGEHRGRLGTRHDKAVRSLFEDRAGQHQGTGNPVTAQPSSRPVDGHRSPSAPATARGGVTDDNFPDWFFEAVKRAWEGVRNEGVRNEGGGPAASGEKSRAPSLTGSLPNSLPGSPTGSLPNSLTGPLTGPLPNSLPGSLTGSLPNSLTPSLASSLTPFLPELSLLSLKICDPSVGSGHFLVGAAHRLARHLARVRAWAQGDSEPSPLLYQQALRDVISRCLYGVDINPMAVELCRINLWLEALEPGKPLSFLDHHIQVGNSLLGTTPALLEAGIPDDAFTAIEGDVKARVTALKKQNKKEREEYKKGQGYLFDVPIKLGNLAAALAKIDKAPDDTAAAVQQKEQHYAELVNSTEYQYGRLLADLWCAAFVWKKDDSDLGKLCPTERDFRKVESHAASGLLPHVRKEVERLRDQYQFFHWHIAFPDVFQLVNGEWRMANSQSQAADATKSPSRPQKSSSLFPDDDTPSPTPHSPFAIHHSPSSPPHSPFAIHHSPSSGFHLMLGNPPWERVKLQEKEWFAVRVPEIASAPNAAARGRLISQLQTERPELHREFMEDARAAEASSMMYRSSGRYPLCGRGDVNVYTLFTELMRNSISAGGRVGCIVPSGIATDDTTKFFFQDIIDRSSLVSLFDFENRAGLFPDVDSRMKFSCLTLRANPTGIAGPLPAEFVFFAQQPEDLHDPERRFTLSAADIALLNPNTRTCPIFRSRRDAELTKAIYLRVPVLIREARGAEPEENPWGIKFSTMFHMSNDSHLFRTRQQLESDGWQLDGNVFRKDSAEPWFPVIEGKMVGAYDHRAANIELNAANALRQQQPELISYEQHLDPYFANEPYLWGPESSGIARTPDQWSNKWFLTFKRVTASTNERTLVGCIIPWTTTSYTLYVVTCEGRSQKLLPCFSANLFSFICDYFARQKTSQPSLPMGVLLESIFLPPNAYTTEISWNCHSQNTGASLYSWLLPRVLELTYTAWDLESFARDCGYTGPPFRWDEERRFLIRAELDAAFFHLYLQPQANGEWGIANGEVDEHGQPFATRHSLLAAFPTPRDAASYIMDTFPIVRRKDEEKYNGDYRTKRVILEIYDALQTATRTGQPYQTPLNPPPGPPTDAHGNFLPPNQWPPDSWPSHIHPPRGEV